eukprot:1677250-Prymnesium_polylepis.1
MHSSGDSHALSIHAWGGRTSEFEVNSPDIRKCLPGPGIMRCAAMAESPTPIRVGPGRIRLPTTNQTRRCAPNMEQ